MKTFKTLVFTVLATASTLASARTIQMDVNGLVCGFCAQGIEKSLRKLPATQGVFVSLADRLVAVEVKDDADIDDAVLRRTLTQAGYTVKAIRRSPESLQAVRQRVNHD